MHILLDLVQPHHAVKPLQCVFNGCFIELLGHIGCLIVRLRDIALADGEQRLLVGQPVGRKFEQAFAHSWNHDVGNQTGHKPGVSPVRAAVRLHLAFNQHTQGCQCGGCKMIMHPVGHSPCDFQQFVCRIIFEMEHIRDARGKSLVHPEQGFHFFGITGQHDQHVDVVTRKYREQGFDGPAPEISRITLVIQRIGFVDKQHISFSTLQHLGGFLFGLSHLGTDQVFPFHPYHMPHGQNTQ